jgi:hypothetical protein
VFPSADSDIHQSVREPHFRPVYNAIAGTLDERQKRRELGIEDKGIQARLDSDQKSVRYSRIDKVQRSVKHTRSASMVSAGPR